MMSAVITGWFFSFIRPSVELGYLNSEKGSGLFPAPSATAWSLYAQNVASLDLAVKFSGQFRTVAERPTFRTFAAAV